MAIAKASKEFIWLKQLMIEFGFDGVDCSLYSDNQSAIYLAKNLVFY